MREILLIDNSPSSGGFGGPPLMIDDYVYRFFNART